MKDYSSYVALIVATETEEKAIKNMYDWKPVTFSDDTQTYYSASIEKNGSSHKIVYARQSEMGMTVAVTLTMKLIEHFRPQFMIWNLKQIYLPHRLCFRTMRFWNTSIMDLMCLRLRELCVRI